MARKERYLVGLDVGTSKVTAVASEVLDAGGLDVVGIGANSVDYVYRLPAAPDFHSIHSKLRLAGHSVSCGGQVATAEGDVRGVWPASGLRRCGREG